MRERELYSPVANWLRSFLSSRYRVAKQIVVEDTSRITIANFLAKHDLLQWQSEGRTYEIKVDVAGAALLAKRGQPIIRLAIVEVKTGAINLRDFSQVLGYAKVLRPSHAFIISPQGWSSSLHQLIREFDRLDVLEYAEGQHITIAKWDLSSGSIRRGDVLSYGEELR